MTMPLLPEPALGSWEVLPVPGGRMGSGGDVVVEGRVRASSVSTVSLQRLRSEGDCRRLAMVRRNSKKCMRKPFLAKKV
jgi:hypothetical protein